jgi:hypothetical protein
VRWLDIQHSMLWWQAQTATAEQQLLLHHVAG